MFITDHELRYVSFPLYSVQSVLLSEQFISTKRDMDEKRRSGGTETSVRHPLEYICVLKGRRLMRNEA